MKRVGRFSKTWTFRKKKRGPYREYWDPSVEMKYLLLVCRVSQLPLECTITSNQSVYHKSLSQEKHGAFRGLKWCICNHKLTIWKYETTSILSCKVQSIKYIWITSLWGRTTKCCRCLRPADLQSQDFVGASRIGLQHPLQDFVSRSAA